MMSRAFGPKNAAVETLVTTIPATMTTSRVIGLKVKEDKEPGSCKPRCDCRYADAPVPVGRAPGKRGNKNQEQGGHGHDQSCRRMIEVPGIYEVERHHVRDPGEEHRDDQGGEDTVQKVPVLQKILTEERIRCGPLKKNEDDARNYPCGKEQEDDAVRRARDLEKRKS